jgi:hypothetical protein
MNIPKIPLKEYEKRWIEKVLEYYDKNEKPDEVQIIIDNQDVFPDDFKSSDINGKLYTNCPYCINLYGIYCFDPANGFLEYVHRICSYFKQEINSNKNYCLTPYVSELHDKLDIPEPQAHVCLALICDFNRNYEHYMPSLSRMFGFHSVKISNLEDIKRYQKYESIESLIKKILKDRETVPANDDKKRSLFSNFLLKSEIADKLDINPALLSRKGSPWKKLFDRYSTDGKRSKIPLNELLQQLKETCLRKNRNDYPKSIKELKSMLE